VQLSLSDQIVDLIGDRFDLALRHGPLADSNLIARPILQTRYFACASPDYLRENGRPENPSEISNHACLTFPLPGFSSTWRFGNRRSEPSQAARSAIDKHELEVPVRSTFSANSGLVLRDCALQGQGIALLSDWLIADDLARGELVDLFPDHIATPSNFQTVISAVYPNRKYTPKKVLVFIGFLQQYLSAVSPVRRDLVAVSPVRRDLVAVSPVRRDLVAVSPIRQHDRPRSLRR
jgi:DNA-binding transcriptional LysR family regulator